MFYGVVRGYFNSALSHLKLHCPTDIINVSLQYTWFPFFTIKNGMSAGLLTSDW